jgi:hypothetical protein
VNRFIKLTVGGALVALTATACKDFLTGGELENDPNRSLEASAENLFNGVQSNLFLNWTSDPSRTVAMWLQQMAGTGQQYLGQGRYDIDESTHEDNFEFIYNQGGLVDIRNIQELAEASGDDIFLGIAQVMEAYTMGSAASLWGDLPYSEAGDPSVGDPALDPMENIYRDVQALLDEAIVNLDGPGGGPENDLNYAGNTAKWTELAYTLKARYYMHWIEAQLKGGAFATAAAVACGSGGTCVEKANAAAQNGISTSANDYKARHTDTFGERNVWYQFIFEQRAGYISAGRFFTDLLKARSDPRLTQYFQPGTTGGQINGAYSGEAITDDFAQLNEDTRVAPDFDQPLVTWAETELILAETEYRMGDEAQARIHLNAVRLAAGITTPVTASGTALLSEIMIEKYIALFQDFEIWNDYKRTCLPAIPIRGIDSGVQQIPGRFLYGAQERQTNENIPDVSEQLATNGGRNRNDPDACPYIAPT